MAVEEPVVVIDLRGISGQLMGIRLLAVIARERSRPNFSPYYILFASCIL
jgi:hypothetical protein